jgi:hypothetical protein
MSNFVLVLVETVTVLIQFVCFALQTWFWSCERQMQLSSMVLKYLLQLERSNVGFENISL